MNGGTLDVQSGLEKAEEPEMRVTSSVRSSKKQESSRKNIYFCFIDYAKAFDIVHFSSVTQLSPNLCGPMNCSMPGLPVHHEHPEFTKTHVYWVSDAIQQSHPLLSPSPPACNFSQHQGLFKWVSSSLQVAKILEFQL